MIQRRPDMKKLTLAVAVALLLCACESVDTTAPVTAAGQEQAADPNAVTVTTSGSVEVGVKSSSR
jgi:heat shock protein HslJ